jgi:hypothetical protein
MALKSMSEPAPGACDLGKDERGSLLALRQIDCCVIPGIKNGCSRGALLLTASGTAALPANKTAHSNTARRV